jgi:hypothetical protein
MLNKIEKIEDVINQSFDLMKQNKYWNLQVETLDSKYNKEFLVYLKSLTDFVLIDGLGGDGESWMQRKNANKSFDDVIDYSSSALKCGIKIVHNPIGSMCVWETWSNGYIEGFVRMDGDSDFNEYFIWLYIKMDHLKNILGKFKDKLGYYK